MLLFFVIVFFVVVYFVGVLCGVVWIVWEDGDGGFFDWLYDWVDVCVDWVLVLVVVVCGVVFVLVGIVGVFVLVFVFMMFFCGGEVVVLF